MKLYNNYTNQIQSSGNIKEKSFGIRKSDMGVVLGILRSRMYSNPIRVICQEICANARDANREVGKETPIYITIQKNIFNRNISDLIISDNGPGIPTELMEEIFINYGASTKRDSNKYTGGFGLGCKTPFAYTDTFSVVTKVDGTKYTYQAVVEQNSTGKIYLMHKQETVENNGTSIVIPINKNDEGIFVGECYRATALWKVQPVFKWNYKKTSHSKYVDNGNISIYSTQIFSSGYYAIIDSIAYKLDEDKLGLPNQYSYAYMLKIPNGKIRIAANREGLHYDDDSLKKIRKKLITSIKKEISYLQDTVNNSKSITHAKIIFSKYMNFYGPILESFKLSINFKKTTISNIKFESLEVLKFDYTMHKSLKIPPDFLSSDIYFVDMKRIVNARLNTLKSKGTNFYLLRKRSRVTAELCEKELSQIKQIKKISNFSDVPYKKGTKSSARKKPGNFIIYNSGRTRVTINYVNRFSNETIAYETFKWVSDIKNSVRNLERVLNIKIMFFKEKDISRIPPNILPLKDVLKIKKHTLTRFAMFLRLEKYTDILEMCKDLNMNQRYQRIANIFRNIIKKNKTKQTRYGRYSYLPEKLPQWFENLLSEIIGIKEKYPLIAYYSNYMTVDDKRHFEEYIRLIDKG